MRCLIIAVAATESFHYVQEWEEDFLALFPHRYDYIYAKHPAPGQTPDWKTESRHPLSDRLLAQGASLFGVRFRKETNYCLLDIDAGSLYHPQRDRFAVSRLLAALESLGLVETVICTSSYSGGLHLYFPFQAAQNTWELALVVTTLLENAGFHLTPGQLEMFPNPRPYAVEGNLSLFNAHRLPMQAGSYLLNKDFQPLWSDQQTFIQHWQFAQNRNSMTQKTLNRLLKQFRRRHYHLSGKAEKFINDLNAEIELGWTGHGQTNRLLGRLTMRAYVFHHILSGGKPLEGQALVDEIVATAQALPGYEEWCQHQHEIVQRATAWARCIEGSRYFHYGDANGKYQPKREAEQTKEPSWNQRQAQATRDRIQQAIADLLNQKALPSGATARFQALIRYSIGGASLYRHRDLWHPNYLSLETVENPPDPPTSNTAAQLDASSPSNWHSPPSLLSENGSNALPGGTLSNHTGHKARPTDGNMALSQSASRSDLLSETNQGKGHVQPPHLDRQTWLETSREAVRSAQQQVTQIRQEARQAARRAQMQQYLESGDPILMAEALAWAAINPGVLQVEHTNLPLIDKPSLDNPPRNLAELLAAIAVHIQRLQWTREQVSDRLWALFGKRNQTRLDDLELAQWRLWLEEQAATSQGDQHDG